MTIFYLASPFCFIQINLRMKVMMIATLQDGVNNMRSVSRAFCSLQDHEYQQNNCATTLPISLELFKLFLN